MVWMKLLPGVLKELLKHVPTVLFQVVDWSKLVSELPRLSNRILKKEGVQELIGLQQNYLSPFSIQLVQKTIKTEEVITKENAELCLHAYFAQLFSPHGLFLDLRSQHFQSTEEGLIWSPSGLWTKFEENFRLGLLKVYEGFYLEDENIYFQGLASIGLMQDSWSELEKKKLGELFKAQFGNALQSGMRFELEKFKVSILKTSNFMLERKVKISNDFLYLGIYLVTLYSHLEQCPDELPVKDIYLKVRSRLA